MQNIISSIVTQKEKEEILTQFQDIVSSFCDKCGNSYNKNDINIIQKQENIYVLHLVCDNCKSNMLTYVIKSVGMSNKVQIFTDLNLDEMKKISSSQSVNSDDVLDIYETLKEEKNIDSFIKKLDA